MTTMAALKKRVLDKYQSCKKLKFPKINLKGIQDPFLMQKRMVDDFLIKKKMANWSEMGTGKTLAAVLCAYFIKAKFTLICCPNDVKSEWEQHIKAVFPEAIISHSLKHIIPNSSFVIVHYEQFQQSWTRKVLNSIVKQYNVDYFVLDEIHQSKQREETASIRRENLVYLRKKLNKKNPDIYVMGLTGTPCINETLREPISILELILGQDLSDLPASVSIANIYRVRQLMIIHGIRCRSNFTQRQKPKITDIDCSHRLKDIVEAKNSLSKLERILTEEKIPFILKNISHKYKTIIYVYYTKHIVEYLRKTIEDAGYNVDTYTGLDTADIRKSVKKKFIEGDTEVLIASRPIGTGVDGLQHACHRIIPLILPWTSAEYAQLIARLERQGQDNEVQINIPRTFAKVNDNEWSLDGTKWNRILYKKSISDVLLDSQFPDTEQLSLHKVKKACLKWLDRVVAGTIYDIKRPEIQLKSEEQRKERNANYSELTKIHINLNKKHSSKTFEQFKDKAEFEKYHKLYNEYSEGWEIIPREELAKLVKKDEVVGDFGCGGKCHIAKLLPKNKVYSFDHNSLGDKNVIVCDMRKVPLKDGQLDVAIFSLSLMGCNYLDYLKEAYRCLKPSGKIHIAELTKHALVKKLPEELKKIGFKFVSDISRKWKFSFILGQK